MQIQTTDASGISTKRIPWHIFLFLFAVFWFATPYDFSYSKNMKTILETMDTGMIIDSVEKGSIGRRIALLSLLCFSVICLFRRGLHGLRSIGLMGYLILFYASWATLSIFWTDLPLLTARRLMVFWILIISAFSMAARLSLKDIAVLTFFISTITLLISIGAELALGVFHPFADGYRFAGVMHPVNQGWNCGLLAISALFLTRFAHGYRSIFRCVFLIAVIFLIFTRSRMPLASVIIALALYWLLSSSGSKIMAWVCGLIVLVCLVYFAFGDELIKHADVFISLGRGSEGLEGVKTLNGRTPLWRECIHYVADRPLCGLGYRIFLSQASLTKVSAAINWIPSDAHSGFIENLVGLGIIGMMLFAGILICGFQRAFSLFGSSSDYLLVITVLTWLCTNLMLESIIKGPVFPAFLSMIFLARLGFVVAEEPIPQESARDREFATNKV